MPSRLAPVRGALCGPTYYERNMNDDTKPLFPLNTYAFPFDVQREKVRDTCPGMTLRDYFAGQALAGLMAQNAVWAVDRAAEVVYDIADAMLKRRESGQ